MNQVSKRHPTQGGERLRKWLALHDFTQTRFAKDRGFAGGSLCRWIRGVGRPPSPAARNKIEAATGIKAKLWDRALHTTPQTPFARAPRKLRRQAARAEGVAFAPTYNPGEGPNRALRRQMAATSKAAS